jgi:hypothetical protein
VALSKGLNLVFGSKRRFLARGDVPVGKSSKTVCPARNTGPDICEYERVRTVNGNSRSDGTTGFLKQAVTVI